MDESMKALLIKDLSYRYSDGRSGLEGVDIEIEKGSKVCLIGRNGSGKTTLLLHINGLLNGEGLIEVMGIRRSRETMKDIRKKTGFLFSQVEHHFIMPELLNDVLLGTDDPDNSGSAMKLLEAFNLTKYIGKNPLELSAGEMKRAALAGVLARDPEILPLDEPLQNLDRENSEKLLSILLGLKKSMLIATHSRFLVERLADQVAIMENGRITALYEKKSAMKRKDVKDLLL
jgi:energy-coupling factor transporter ATP-binding protein EcfA2